MKNASVSIYYFIYVPRICCHMYVYYIFIKKMMKGNLTVIRIISVSRCGGACRRLIELKEPAETPLEASFAD